MPSGNDVRVRASVDDKISGPLTQIEKKFQGLGKSMGGSSHFGMGVGLAAGATAFTALASAASGVTGAITGSVEKAVDFERSMLNVASISGETGTQLDRTGRQVINLSTKFGQSADTMAKGLYDISSSGFQGRDAMKVLESASLGAAAGLSTTGEAAAGITAVLNAYGLKASDATRVSDVMFQTVNRGVISFPQLSAEIGKTTALAAPLGVSLEEVGAGIAVLTRHGIDGANATTQLNAVMTSILKPSAQAAALAKQLGIDWSVAGLKAKGFAGFLADMIQKTGGSQEAMAALLGDARAIRGAFVLASDGGKELNDELAIMNDSAGAAGKAFEIQSQSAAFAMAQMRAEAEKTEIQFGQKMLPVVKGTMETIIYALDRTAVPLEKLQEAAAHGAGGAMSQLNQLEGVATGLGISMDAAWKLVNESGTTNLEELRGALVATVDGLDTTGNAARDAWNTMGSAATAGAVTVEDAAGKVDHSADMIVGGLGKVDDKADTTALSMLQAAGIITQTWETAEHKLERTAQATIDNVFKPLILHDEFVANKATIAAARRVLASKTASRAERRDAQATIDKVEMANLELAVQLAKTGKLSHKEQADLLKDLKKRWHTATGSAKADLASLIAMIEGLPTNAHVSIRVGGNERGRARAIGGPVSKGSPYIVGERGEELFVPKSDGTIIPHNKMGGWRTPHGMDRMGGATVVVQAILNHSGLMTPATSRDFEEQAGPAIANYLVRRGLVQPRT